MPALGVVALVALFWPRGDGKKAATGGFLIDPAGRAVPVSTRLAPVTLVHFWATWCPPCITEIPSLNRLDADLAEYRGDFAILMISVADDPDRVKEFVGDRLGATLFDPDWDVAHRYGTRKLPETYLVVRGEVKEQYVGAQNWDDPALRKVLLDQLAGLRSGATASP